MLMTSNQVRCLATVGVCTLWLGATADAATGATSLFQSLKGYWSGSGKVVDNAGKSEQIRCRVSYAVSADKTGLNQTLTCASSSYKFDVVASLADHDGKVTGQWQEKTRGASGAVTGSVVGNALETNVSGPGFSAALSVRVRGATQSVLIRPQGADVSEISIALHH